jgi:hypothetical protein
MELRRGRERAFRRVRTEVGGGRIGGRIIADRIAEQEHQVSGGCILERIAQPLRQHLTGIRLGGSLAAWPRGPVLGLRVPARPVAGTVELLDFHGVAGLCDGRKLLRRGYHR